MTALQETEDGRYLITLSGVSRFRLGELQEGFAPYLRAAVDWASFERDLGRAEKDEGFDRPAFLDVLARFFDTAQLSSDWDSLKEADPELLINSLSILCPFDPEEKQALLGGADAREPARDAGDADGVRAALERRRGGDAVSEPPEAPAAAAQA